MANIQKRKVKQGKRYLAQVRLKGDSLQSATFNG